MQKKVQPKNSKKLPKEVTIRDHFTFPIVGIGASAGGLEALELFLSNVEENSGIAYVVVQHLDPTQKGMLPELLQRVSKLKIFQVKDRMAVKQDCVYVIPPNKSMSILNGVLHLFDPVEVRGLRLPIDYFLRSLADDRKEMSVGLILSGMGSDGSLGLRAIKEKNGIVMVQDPTTAKFDSMPRNAIDSVIADIVAPANEIPSKLLDFLKHIPIAKYGLDSELSDQSGLEKVIILLRSKTGNDFSLYKKNTLYRRIERRMGIHKISKLSAYVRFLQENPKEVDILFKELMIGVTNFFRDPGVWEKMQEAILPDLISSLPNDSIFRAWVPGCSTGEEAYTLAIIFKEVLEKMNPHGGISLQIFATDLDNDAIEIARKGLYQSNIVADISASRLSRFFVASDEGYRVNSEIREMVVFAQHNIIMHPPFTKIDILSCRNLLIYMDAELQQKLLGLFYYSLNPSGVLVLGSSESLGSLGHLFSAIENKLKIYKRSVTLQVPEFFDFPSSFSRTKPSNFEKPAVSKSGKNIQELADQLILQQFAPAGVLVNENGDIIYISGRTGKYLEPAVGKANLNIFAMLREGLRHEFPILFRKALVSESPVYMHNVKVGTNGGTQLIHVTIQLIKKPEHLHGMVIVIFSDVVDTPQSRISLKKGVFKQGPSQQTALEVELQHTKEEVQHILEEMQSSQEELKSANEELQSTNEELQSTNEELTTSKEEMQSLNEELQTVNAELQSKVDDFSHLNNDMKNLLNSTDIATLFLDKELNIRRFTIQATRIFKLIRSDIGRPFTDLVSELEYPELANDATEVLRSLVFMQKQIPTRDGRWFSTRIMPYRTFDDRIDGLVITFINITDLKQVEVKLEESKQLNEMLMKSSAALIINLSEEGKIVGFNQTAEEILGKKARRGCESEFYSVIRPKARPKGSAEKYLKTG